MTNLPPNTYLITHPVHGECIGDDFSLAHRYARDNRGSKVGDCVTVEDDAIDAHEELSDGYDIGQLNMSPKQSRKVNALRGAGINTIAEFVEACANRRGEIIGLWGFSEDNIGNYLARAEWMLAESDD